MKKFIIGIGVVVILGVGYFLLQGPPPEEAEGTSVEMFEVKQQTPLHLKGQVKSTKKQTVLIDSDKGPIRTIHVNEGDHVAKNTILLTYRWGEVVRADNDSLVTMLNEDAKNDSQQQLMVLKSEESSIKGTVTEYDRSKIVLNEPVEIKYANSEKTVSGKIISLAEMNNEAEKEDKDSLVTYNFTAVPDEAIPVGYSVELLIPRNEIHLPLKSVVEKDGQTFVYTVSNKKAKKQPVTIEKGNGYYLLHEGLNESQKIIKDASSIKDGMDVNVK
ncbi:efflux RND transporter periplasmic adaptor subunit [Candidatus Enterococcus murrayae]|uniref:Efflux RND transporter periplasmic adaptor subunit n=1 Tax=Candidatus Enterococcus murrayae TaxID=2815321 RepID=A0ABS3HCJ7_9ENTE|nr:efflux RND transporter periplasmic adaptor subunit [Enterococcus sp. MJM16]MBO0451166.1 efflux RND transporter periplasmic adaptor subunit [Enterococcus sp. MJM16]